MRIAALILWALLAPLALAQSENATLILLQAEANIFSGAPEIEANCLRVIELAADKDHAVHARALRIHGRVLLEKGRFAEARPFIEKAVDVGDKHLDNRAVAAAHIVFAHWYARRGEHGRTVQHRNEAARLIANKTSREKAELALLRGLEELARGAHPHGVPNMYTALDLAYDYGLDDIAVQVHLAMAKVAERQGSFDAGDEHAKTANKLITRNHYRLLEPAGAFAQAMLAKGRKEPAATQRKLLKRSIELAEATKHPTWMAEADRWRGHIAHWIDNDQERALKLYERGIKKALIADDLDCLGYLVALAAQVHEEAGRSTEALALLDEHGQPNKLCGDTRLRVHVNRTRAKAYAALGQFEAAHRCAWDAADTVRWLARHESTGKLLTHEYDLRSERYQQATIFWVVVATLALAATILLLRLHHVQRKTNSEQGRLNAELETALSQVQELRGLLPICANCKSIRDDDGYWHRIEHYLTHHSKASLSHGICPDCADDLYPDLVPSLKKPDRPDSKAV